ncbi:unnamed protein product [Paramecium primaurelia]|uniref:Uncharacterized protein n=1 Tax=Paramecium primaurelia TaxID=5886 RepID=A0A8S1PAR8_PARPR|nr:unnamed protein product [Paramecium primaurelia]
MMADQIFNCESFEDISNYIQYQEQDSLPLSFCHFQENQNNEDNTTEMEILFDLNKNEDVIMESDQEEKKKIREKLENVFKRQLKKEKKSKFQNECRYIVGNAIQAMENFELPQDIVNYYKRIGSSIIGFQALKQHLILNKDDSNETIQRKRIFQGYLIEFLQKKASLYILKSRKKQKLRQYLQYKNNIMMFYVKYPELWHRNELPHFDQQQYCQSQHLMD